VNATCGLIPENDWVNVIVRIGAALHPMEEKHFIRFIDCYLDQNYIGRVLLTPGLNPAACFHLKTKGTAVIVVENCTIHGYWMVEQPLA
jgi:superoxide reductase